MVAVPHRHVVLSVPRRLRLLFRRDRSRLAKLARAAWETVKELLQAAAGDKLAVPGGVACLQTYGNLLDCHPHAHLLVSWGVFRPDGTFVPVTDVPAKETIEKLFRHKILRMLKDEGAIDDAVIENLLSWPNTALSERRCSLVCKVLFLGGFQRVFHAPSFALRVLLPTCRDFLEQHFIDVFICARGGWCSGSSEVEIVRCSESSHVHSCTMTPFLVVRHEIASRSFRAVAIRRFWF